MKEKTKGWVFFAERDMLMAETAISDSRLTGQVAFHSQQTIEKYFKAYLTEFDFAFPKIHDLIKLYDFVKAIKDWNIDEKMLFAINRIYSESRYPSNIGLVDGQLPSTEKVKEVLDFAKKIEGIFKIEVPANTQTPSTNS
ncbi:MAG: HEPN domain-containing protein [Fibromonadaceae bacterium]|jgi:HEPN domain-containing protein|nr:HEPN domain-containing protein [Fibromonadaceae bacterium]